MKPRSALPAPVGAPSGAIGLSCTQPWFAPRGAPTKARSWAVLAGVATCFVAIASAQSPTDFAARAEVQVPPGTSIVRAALPAASIAAMRSANGGDLRVFNSSGLSLPHALIDASSEVAARAEVPGQRVLALPIYSSDTATSSSTPTLRIEEGPTRRVIEYSSGKATTNTKLEPRGLLFDTRKVTGEVSGLELEGKLPGAMIATILKVSLDASTDLKTWRTLATDAPIFDFGTDGPRQFTVTLPSPQKLTNHYLRLTSSASNAAAVTAITALKALVVEPVKASASTVIPLGDPTMASDAAAEWSRPAGFAIRALHVQTLTSNALMPVRILARSRPGDPWLTIGSTVVYRLAAADGSVSVNPSLPVFTGPATAFRVEPLPGYRLTGVPLTLGLEYPPLQVLFVATGDRPFTIASGQAGLASAALPPSTLIPNYVSGAEFSTPLLTATSLRVDAGTTASGASPLANLANRSTILWVVLALAVLILAGLAVSLLRAPKPK